MTSSPEGDRLSRFDTCVLGTSSESWFCPTDLSTHPLGLPVSLTYCPTESRTSPAQDTYRPTFGSERFLSVPQKGKRLSCTWSLLDSVCESRSIPSCSSTTSNSLPL